MRNPTLNRLSRPVLVAAFLIGLSAVAATPALWAGFLQTHDGLFHLYRLAALDHAIHEQAFYPRLFPEFAFGYGYPVLNFYAPATYYLGELLHLLGLDIQASYNGLVVIGFLGAAASMYLFARSSVGRIGAMVAAAVYTFVPYHLAEVYVRGALPEFLAFVFPPLVLWSVQRLSDTGHSRYLVVGGLGTAGLLLVHNLTAFMFAPLLAAYIVVLALRTRSRGFVVQAAVSQALGVGLSAFYWLPALVETRYVALGAEISSGTGYARHMADLGSLLSPFLDYRYFPDQGVPFDYPLSLAQATLLALALVAAVWLWLRKDALRWQACFFAVTLVLALLLTTTLSLPVWHALPVLSVLQYPWRFLVIAGLSGAVLAGLAADRAVDALRARSPLASALGLAAIALACVALVATSLWQLPATPKPLNSDSLSSLAMWANDAGLGQIGATWSGEYVPVTVSAARADIPQPAVRAGDTGAPLPPGTTVTLIDQGYDHLALETDSVAPFGLVFHTFHFPGWTIRADGVALPARAQGDLGLSSADIPAGIHQVEVRFDDTPVRLAGWGIAIVTALALVGTLLWRRPSRRATLAVLGAVAVIVALATAHTTGTLASDRQTSTARFGEVTQLAGYRLPQHAARAGETASVDLTWLSLAAPSTDYKVFVHVLDSTGRVVAQQDGDPGGGYTPTTRWYAGELVPDTHVVALPPDLPAGEYTVAIGLYALPDVRNLPVAGAASPAPDGRLALGTLVVEP